MAELFLEILSEEIPARMQAKAGQNLERALTDGLKKAGLTVDEGHVFWGPRRLVFTAQIPARSPDISEERKGPRVGSPEQALAGFLRGAGLSDISQAETRSDKKGDHYVAVINKPGQAAGDIVSDLLPAVMGNFPWPKSMKSGADTFRWVRPLTSIICQLDGHDIGVTVAGLKSGNTTQGHRRMGPGPFTVSGFEDYRAKIEGAGKVMLSAHKRKDLILEHAQRLCQKAGLELIDDEGLLIEVAGLVEYPVVILGDMAPEFLKLPGEVIRLSMRTHQKYFSVRDPKTGGLAPNFIVVANQVAPDGGKAIAQGNSRVLSARLSDAVFFQSEDAKNNLIDYYDKLGTVVFHKKLGSIRDKAQRVQVLARELAPIVGADADKAALAAKLSKCDLVTNMVIEFTSLQGQIGRLMYEAEGGEADIALAVEEHYKPQGPSDAVPCAPISVAVALADKLDTLVGFWAIDEKPTGSKDPYALRRAALGLVRIVLETGVRLPLSDFAESDLITFILDRLKGYLKDEGLRHDVIDAALAIGEDDLVAITARAKALQAFLDDGDGENLVAGYKRAANILRAEAKKGDIPSGEAGVGTDPAEKALYAALTDAAPRIDAALNTEDYAAAMTALAALRGPIDSFFDDVMVNSDIAAERENRLKLLGMITQIAGRIASFDALDG